MTDVRIITESLGGSPLSQLLQSGEAPIDWVASAPRSAAEWTERATRRARERQWDERWSELEPAFAATGAAAERLDRVRRSGGIVVSTGQQAGLFGGPIYTWSKAMGVLAMADAIERATGIAAAPVFWAATDDADFAEAAYTVVARIGGAELLRSENAPTPGTPMSLAALGDISHPMHLLRSAVGSAANSRALETTVAAYGDPSHTVGDAFVALLRDLLSSLGVSVLDASHAAVRTASEPTLRAALRDAAKIEKALATRTRDVRAAGFHPQVEDVPGLSLVFKRDGAIKRRLSVAEAGAAAEDRSAWLTPTVLLRPIVEQAILPTVGYLGGPGELAYFAQASAVADALGVERPLGLPRWSCTLIEPHIQRLLDAFGVGPDALARPDALEGVVARRAMAGHSSVSLAQLREVIGTMPAALAAESKPLGLTAAVQGSMQSLLHRVDRLERRLVARIKQRESDLLRDVATLRAALYPRGTRQERALNLVPILSRHGLDLLAKMRDAASAHAARLIDRSATGRPA